MRSECRSIPTATETLFILKRGGRGRLTIRAHKYAIKYACKRTRELPEKNFFNIFT